MKMLDPYRLKTQDIRLLDVFLLGPLMLYAAALIPEEHRATRMLLALFGGSTLSYNWVNYQKAQTTGHHEKNRNPRGSRL